MIDFVSFVVIWLLCLVATPFVAGAKGRSGTVWFFLALVLGLLALLLVAILPERNRGWTLECRACRSLMQLYEELATPA